MSVVEDVQSYLASEGLVDGATGWTSRRRAITDDTDQIVVITEDGGMAPEVGRASGIGDVASRFPAVQVLVRADPWQGDDSEAKAQAIYDALHGLTNVTMGSGTYQRVTAQTSGPVFALFDDRNRPRHTISFRLAASQPAPA